MKSKKILSALLLATLVTGTLAGCNNGGETDTSSSTNPGSSNLFRVTLAHNIYLKGQEPVVLKSETWSDTLNDWREASGQVIAEFDREATGEVEVTFKSGNKSCKQTIKVYATAEEAAADNSFYSEDKIEELKLSRIYDENSKKVKFESYEEIIDEEFTGVKIKYGKEIVVDAVNEINTSSTVWTEDAETGVLSYLYEQNPEAFETPRYSTPHTWKENVPVVDENGDPVLDESGNQLTEYKYSGKYNAAYDEARWMTEMIFDKYGRLCLFVWCYPANVWTGLISNPDGVNWYSHSVYADNNTNPALLFADDYYDADGNVANPEHFEKVIPQGGSYLVAANGGVQVTSIFQAMSGLSYTITDANLQQYGFLNQTVLRGNERMEGSRCLYDADSKSYTVYIPANHKQLYAYYLAQVEAGAEADATKWAEAKATGELVLKGLIEETNPLIVEEPVLEEYYATYLDDLFTTWRTQVLANTTEADPAE